MTQCAEGCGACCDPLVLPYNRMDAMLDPRISLEDRKWAERSLTAMPEKEAFRLAPWLKGKALRDQFGDVVRPFFFRCRHFDRETRRCTDYENRPEMCRDYPWYGAEPRVDAALPPTCSFRADIGQVPVEITRKPG